MGRETERLGSGRVIDGPVWEPCGNESVLHTLHWGWIVHHWLAYGDFFCFYHCESTQEDRIELKLLYHEYLGPEPTGHTCEEYEPRPDEVVDKHVWNCIYSKTWKGVLAVIENVERTWVEVARKEMGDGKIGETVSHLWYTRWT